MFEQATKLLVRDALTDEQIERLLTSAGFANWRDAHKRIFELPKDESERRELRGCLPMLLDSLSDAATPDGSLVNFDRFAQSVPNRAKLFQYLAENPRAVQILIKLFVGSQFLTEILLRNPTYLEQLTQHKRLAEFKSRQQMLEDAADVVAEGQDLDENLDTLRRFQHWELLRIGACDSFGLMDLKSVTVQLSLLADCIVQTCLRLITGVLEISTDDFAVLAFGKLGGEELNYSSDIDLVFISRTDASRYWPLGQRLIKALISATAEGFLYRTDMRLRPWGRSGALVTTIDGYLEYLNKHGMLWEKQALLKARVIAGNFDVGDEFLKRVETLIFSARSDEIRASIQETKDKIEANLDRKGRKWGEVKSGAGSIRDVEFVTQFLQMSLGRLHPEVRSMNTLGGLVRLADFGFLRGDEFRLLSTGYGFLRTIEHALQLMHHKQIHALPDDEFELTYLARRLDFPTAEQFLTHYQRHCTAIRAIYDKYIRGEADPLDSDGESTSNRIAELAARLEPSYLKIFSEEEIEHHACMLDQLNHENVVEVDVKEIDPIHWQATIAGFDHSGDLSMICGLLLVYGFDIKTGNVFTDTQVARRQSSRSRHGIDSKQRDQPTGRRFVNVFVVHSERAGRTPNVWKRYREDLAELMQFGLSGNLREAQGRLVKRAARAFLDVPKGSSALFPVDIQIDNKSSPSTTVLNIRGEDTIGFLYELTNALALAGVDIVRVTVASIGNQVFDTLHVTDQYDKKITDDDRQHELRAAVVLIKHFTHLLPSSPNPETALLHFREFLEQLFQQPNWLEELSSLQQSKVLEALARLLGVSEFLWDDFLRLQHANLFPVVRDIESLEQPKSRDMLQSELESDLADCHDNEESRRRLNAFKDREMFRIDMRHILGHIDEFGQFSAELTDVAEVVVAGTAGICETMLAKRFGTPVLPDGTSCPMSICALGKCGGRELGFASDIELMFIYQDNGRTSGPAIISSTEYFLKLVEEFTQTIKARRKGIFEIDLRLRPYGRAGSLAVSRDAFESYFAPDGAAWPYERQALVKLRPIAGDEEFGNTIVQLRDRLVYTGEPFDVTAMRAMREKQVRQLVKAGTVNAKLSPGGLVDCEYLVQGLQITHGADIGRGNAEKLRATNTRQAMAALTESGVLSEDVHQKLRNAYIFQRRLIDALRMVRGDARDLTVPASDTEEFEFLARRLGYGDELTKLSDDIERHSQTVVDLGRLLNDA